MSRIATLTGYLEIVCDRILTKIMGNEIPGDSRTNIGFITYDSSVHFYQIASSDGGQPKQLIVSDVSGKYYIKLGFLYSYYVYDVCYF